MVNIIPKLSLGIVLTFTASSLLAIFIHQRNQKRIQREIKESEERQLQLNILKKLETDYFNRCLFFPSAPAESADPNSSLSQLLDILNQAKIRLRICVMTVTYGPLIRTMIRKRDEGVMVQLYTTNWTDLRKGRKLKNKGIEVRSKNLPYCSAMHNKFIIIDDIAIVSGSLNWTKEAVEHNEENLLVTNDWRIVSKFIQQFSQIWEDFEKPENLAYRNGWVPGQQPWFVSEKEKKQLTLALTNSPQ